MSSHDRCHPQLPTIWLTMRTAFAGQAEAVRHGIATALQGFDASLRPPLKAAGFMTRDPRKRERKKPGQKGARKKFACECSRFVLSICSLILLTVPTVCPYAQGSNGEFVCTRTMRVLGSGWSPEAIVVQSAEETLKGLLRMPVARQPPPAAYGIHYATCECEIERNATADTDRKSVV